MPRRREASLASLRGSNDDPIGLGGCPANVPDAKSTLQIRQDPSSPHVYYPLLPPGTAMGGMGWPPTVAPMQINIDRESPIPPSAQLANYLRDQIKRGKIPVGRRIPSLTELEAATGLARETIQKATRKLKDEGLVETVPGMGLYVTERKSE